VVATPIGNLEDISSRALESLARADAIAAEDTRVTARLLEHHRVQGKLVAAHEHNERRAADWIVEQLALGKTVALVTDAGTPAVSDPGATVVARVRAAGFKVVPVPGPNAAVTALSAAGIAEAPFLFAGFLPAKPTERRKALERLAELPYTLVLYEAPHRIVQCVEDMSAALGPERTLLIARELTKLFEQIHRCRLGEAAAWLRADGDRQRGEFVLIAEGAAAKNESAKLDWERVLTTLLAELPLAHAVKLACKLTGAKKNAVYARALQLARDMNARRS
jgi:16S rRNA (cytidine1402-2'-O)-methyltransferase